MTYFGLVSVSESNGPNFRQIKNHSFSHLMDFSMSPHIRWSLQPFVHTCECFCFTPLTPWLKWLLHYNTCLSLHPGFGLFSDQYREKYLFRKRLRQTTSVLTMFCLGDDENNKKSKSNFLFKNHNAID